MPTRQSVPERPTRKVYLDTMRRPPGAAPQPSPARPADDEPVEQPIAPVRKLRAGGKQRRRRTILGSLAAVGALALLSGAGSYSWQSYQHAKLASVLPAEARAQLKFPAYVTLAAKASVDKNSVTSAPATLSYTAHAGSTALIVAEQPQPSDFDINNYATKGVGISGADAFSVPAGKALTGIVAGRRILIVSTGKTLITITAESGTTADALREFAKNLQAL
ncbi:MAG TPA: hypothetical protein VLH86_04215 [Patescibacteria group bacterium]|nr:hypothetical protein [Patescibacteria group bacterium]